MKKAILTLLYFTFTYSFLAQIDSIYCNVISFESRPRYSLTMYDVLNQGKQEIIYSSENSSNNDFVEFEKSLKSTRGILPIENYQLVNYRILCFIYSGNEIDTLGVGYFDTLFLNGDKINEARLSQLTRYLVK